MLTTDSRTAGGSFLSSTSNTLMSSSTNSFTAGNRCPSSDRADGLVAWYDCAVCCDSPGKTVTGIRVRITCVVNAVILSRVSVSISSSSTEGVFSDPDPDPDCPAACPFRAPSRSNRPSDSVMSSREYGVKKCAFPIISPRVRDRTVPTRSSILANKSISSPDSRSAAFSHSGAVCTQSSVHSTACAATNSVRSPRAPHISRAMYRWTAVGYQSMRFPAPHPAHFPSSQRASMAR